MLIPESTPSGVIRRILSVLPEELCDLNLKRMLAVLKFLPEALLLTTVRNQPGFYQGNTHISFERVRSQLPRLESQSLHVPLDGSQRFLPL